jgi:hypothetical protein
MTQLLDYPLCRLMYELHGDRALSARYRADRESVLAGTDISEQLKDALRCDDVAALAPHTNGFLLRYYFTAAGVPEPAFLAGLQKIGEPANG